VFATTVTWVTLAFEADGRLSLDGWRRRTLLALAANPLGVLAAMVQIAAGLWLVSYAVIGARRTPPWEALRLPALPPGLAVIFLL
jgi:hypothetical protein